MDRHTVYHHDSNLHMHGIVGACEGSLAEAAGVLFVNNYYAGGFIHADDIRTLAKSVSSLNGQVALVKQFAETNFLKLNVQMCENQIASCFQKCTG